MDSTPPCIDFAVIGHQDSWENVTAFVNGLRTSDQEKLSVEKVKSIFPFIPPRDLFRVKVKSQTGVEINGVYIDTFIEPDKLGSSQIKINISKVINAISHSTRMGAKIVTLGGFTSIVLEGNLHSYSSDNSKFTTGNTLTAAYIVKGVEKAANKLGIDLPTSAILIIGATGDLGLACIDYFKSKCKKLLLCARNPQRLKGVSQKLAEEEIPVGFSISLDDLIPLADVIICVASATELKLTNCKENVLICDAGYPKNVEAKMESTAQTNLFHGGMGQVSGGIDFYPDYSKSIYIHPAPCIIHGCILEAMILAFESKFENYSEGKGKITTDKLEEIYGLSLKHGVTLAPFYNAKGLW